MPWIGNVALDSFNGCTLRHGLTSGDAQGRRRAPSTMVCKIVRRILNLAAWRVVR